MKAELLSKLKSLKKQPEEKRRLIYYGVLLIMIPLLLMVWFFSVRASLENIALNPNVATNRESLGPRWLRLTSGFMAEAQAGSVKLFQSVAAAGKDFDWQARFYSLWLRLWGRPEIKELPPGSPVPLPIAN